MSMPTRRTTTYGARVTGGQSACSVDAPEELAHRIPDAEYLEIL